MSVIISQFASFKANPTSGTPPYTTTFAGTLTITVQTIAGSYTYPANGALIEIQIYQNGAWNTVGSTTTDANGNFTVPVTWQPQNFSQSGTWNVRAYYPGNYPPTPGTTSKSIAITINLAPTTGILAQIQIIDLARNIAYTWVKNVTYPNGYWLNNLSGGPYTAAPQGQAPLITPGANNLQIIVWATNIGQTTGTLTVTIKDSNGNTLASNSGSASQGNDVVAETGAINMPSTSYSISISTTP